MLNIPSAGGKKRELFIALPRGPRTEERKGRALQRQKTTRKTGKKGERGEERAQTRGEREA